MIKLKKSTGYSPLVQKAKVLCQTPAPVAGIRLAVIDRLGRVRKTALVPGAAEAAIDGLVRRGFKVLS
jgi:hypothetical protein